MKKVEVEVDSSSEDVENRVEDDNKALSVKPLYDTTTRLFGTFTANNWKLRSTPTSGRKKTKLRA